MAPGGGKRNSGPHRSTRRASGQGDGRTPLRFGALGAPGSFSEEAARTYAAREGLTIELHNMADFDAVLSSLDEERIELGILPVSNTVGGLVRASFEAMGRHRFEPIGQVHLTIHHSFLVRSPEVQPELIERIASHPQALAQCSGYLTREFPGREWLEWSDTASAARDLGEGRLDAAVAVIASERAARNYHLHVLRADIEDDPQNETRFVIVRRLSA